MTTLLDVFGVHGIGGMTGTLLAGVFATSAIGGTAGLIEGHPQAGADPALRHRGHPGVVRRRHLRRCSSW